MHRLGMLSTFLALLTALSFMSPRRCRSAPVHFDVPIALLANVCALQRRIYDAFGSENVFSLAHDLSGWLMMPFVLRMGLEIWYMNSF